MIDKSVTEAASRDYWSLNESIPNLLFRKNAIKKVSKKNETEAEDELAYGLYSTQKISLYFISAVVFVCCNVQMISRLFACAVLLRYYGAVTSQ